MPAWREAPGIAPIDKEGLKARIIVSLETARLVLRFIQASDRLTFSIGWQLGCRLRDLGIESRHQGGQNQTWIWARETGDASDY